jgi:hypothetical protein
MQYDEPQGALTEQLLYNVVYCSRASAGVDSADVDAIVATARRLNPALGITGILVFGSDVFFQWLEGPKTAVLDLMKRIETDRRHETIVVLNTGEEMRERVFPNWDMELVGVEDIQEVLLDALETVEDNKSIEALQLLLDKLEANAE